MSGGGSTYRVSHILSRGMIECVRRLASKSDYTGVGMFEFRLDPTTGEFILLEVNARLWGSLPLPIAAGVDFPYLLYRLLVDNHEEAMQAYKIGLYGRNVTADFYCTVENFSRIKEKSLGAALGYLGRTVIQWLRVLTPYEKHDSLARDDPQPGLREYRDILAKMRDAVWHRMTFSERANSK